MIRLHELTNIHISSPQHLINIILVINIDNKIHSKAVLDDKSTADVDVSISHIPMMKRTNVQ